MDANVCSCHDPPVADADRITMEHAYAAVARYLASHDVMWPSSEVGVILAGMRLFADGAPANAGSWLDWTAAVALAADDEHVDPVAAELRATGRWRGRPEDLVDFSTLRLRRE